VVRIPPLPFCCEQFREQRAVSRDSSRPDAARERERTKPSGRVRIPPLPLPYRTRSVPVGSSASPRRAGDKAYYNIHFLIDPEVKNGSDVRDAGGAPRGRAVTDGVAPLGPGVPAPTPWSEVVGRVGRSRRGARRRRGVAGRTGRSRASSTGPPSPPPLARCQQPFFSARCHNYTVANPPRTVRGCEGRFLSVPAFGGRRSVPNS
jgi:hypothetical protein